ncbi:hypothetical protein H5T87_07555 [bacterium]|nr:hypothetical protein [bacterium]
MLGRKLYNFLLAISLLAFISGFLTGFSTEGGELKNKVLPSAAYGIDDKKRELLSLDVGLTSSYQLRKVRFSPNGETLALEAFSGGSDKLYLLNLRDKKIDELISLEKDFYFKDFSWIPNTQKICFVKMRCHSFPSEGKEGDNLNQFDVYTVDIPTRACTLIVEKATLFQPSPDGSSFCYIPIGEGMRKGIVYQRWDNPKSKRRFFFELGCIIIQLVS